MGFEIFKWHRAVTYVAVRRPVWACFRMQWSIFHKSCPFTISVGAPGKDVSDVPMREDVLIKFVVFNGFFVYWT